MSKEIISDELLRKAVARAIEIESSMYERKFALEKEHSFSGKYAEQMKGLLADLDQTRECSEKKIVNYSVKKKSTRVKILLIAAIVMLMGTMTVLAVEPLREKVYIFIEKIFSDHTYVSFMDINNKIDAERGEIDKEDYPKEIKKIPDEYDLIMEINSLEEVGLYKFMQVFQNGEGNTLVYKQNAIFEMDESSLSITSDGTKAEEIGVCGEVAYLLTDEEGYRTIVYANNGFLYMLGGYEEKAELIDLLESVFD